MASKTKLLQPLPSDVRSIVRSGIAITSVAQCVEELVYNSIDAGAKSIFVSVNIDHFHVRVEDDGEGLSEADLEAVGGRYITSKCHCVEDLKNLKFYGFRGEALASIIDVSGTVDIISRPWTQDGLELKKKFENGKVSGFVKEYNSSNKTRGTTIVVGRLLSKLPVRQKRIDKSIQLEEVKSCLDKIVLINPALNLELRNEKTGAQLFNFKSSSSYSEAFDQLHHSRLGVSVNFVQEHFLYKELFLNLSISNEYYKKNSFQYVFVNNRFIQRCKIHRWVGQKILSMQKSVSVGSPKIDKYPIFILSITCPLNAYDITVEPKKQAIEFKNWEVVESGVDGLVTKLKAGNSLNISKSCTKKDPVIEKNASTLSSFDFKNAIHSKFVGRKEIIESEADVVSNRSSKSEGSGMQGRNLSQISGGKRVTNRSLTRTGSNSRVVDVRELRKRRLKGGGGSNALVRNFVPPKLNKRVDSKPKITLGIFNKFSEWKDEFEKKKSPEPVPLKKHKLNNENERSENQCAAAAAEPPKTCASTLSWNINRYFESFDDENRSLFVQDTPSSAASIKAISNPEFSRLSTPKSVIGNAGRGEIGSKSVEGSRVGVKTPTREDVQEAKVIETINERGERYMQNLVKNEWKLGCPREDILRRIYKAWQLTDGKQEERNLFRAGIKSSASSVNDKSEFEHMDTTEFDKDKMQFFKQFSVQPTETSHAPSTSVFSHSRISYIEAPEFSSNPGATATETSNICGSFLGTEDRGPMNVKDSGCAPPPLLNLFPCQKISTSDWNDKMLQEDYTEDSSELFPNDWSVELVSDSDGQEWLQTADTNGRPVYINLSTGKSSYDMVHLFGTVKKVTAGDIRKENPLRYSWLRKHFPRGFRQFWDGTSREVSKEGDLSKINNSLIRESIFQGVQKTRPELSKWRDDEGKPDDIENSTFSQYFEGNDERASDKNEDADKVKSKLCSSNAEFLKRYSTGAMSSFRFTREDFNNVHVIGQYDRKFILASIRKSLSDKSTLVIFDQHAVHERIRLEKFMEESSRISKTSGKKQLVDYEIMPPLPLQLSESDVRILKNYRELFRENGVKFQQISSTCVKIKSAPKCLLERVAGETLSTREKMLQNLLHNLMQELIHHIFDTKGASFTGIPKTIHDVLCSQACHGAIKFGDELDLPACQNLISQLTRCKNMFQCAHGRPSMAPLIKSNDLAKSLERNTSCDPPTIVGWQPCQDDHTECSSYFCAFEEKYENVKEITSGYFSSLPENDTAPLPISNRNPVDLELEYPKYNNLIFKKSQNVTVSQEANFEDMELGLEDTDDDEDSPYFVMLNV